MALAAVIDFVTGKGFGLNVQSAVEVGVGADGWLGIVKKSLGGGRMSRCSSARKYNDMTLRVQIFYYDAHMAAIFARTQLIITSISHMLRSNCLYIRAQPNT